MVKPDIGFQDGLEIFAVKPVKAFCVVVFNYQCLRYKPLLGLRSTSLHSRSERDQLCQVRIIRLTRK